MPAPKKPIEIAVSAPPEFWNDVIAVLMEAPIAARVVMPLVVRIQNTIAAPTTGTTPKG